MAKFAPIIPADWFLRSTGVATYRKVLLGDYHMMLAHNVVARPNLHRDLSLDFPDDSYLILDNSVVETGKADIDVLRDAIDIVYPQCIVMPDVLMKGEETLFETTKAWTQLSDLMWKRGIEGMVVPQGATYEEWLNCLRMLLDLKPDVIGIPRNIEQLGLHRSTVVQDVSDLCGAKIHLLGMSNNVIEDVRACRSPRVMGIDSCLPAMLGAHGEPILLGKRLEIPFEINPDTGVRPPIWEQQNLTEERVAMIINNVRKMRVWLDAENVREGGPIKTKPYRVGEQGSEAIVQRK